MRLRLLTALFLLLASCVGSSDSTDANQNPKGLLGIPGTRYDGDATEPDAPPIAYLAPEINGRLTTVQLTNASTGEAQVVGLPGAVAVDDGVDQVCAANLSSGAGGSVVCADPKIDGSVLFSLGNAREGDRISIFTNGPEYA